MSATQTTTVRGFQVPCVLCGNDDGNVSVTLLPRPLESLSGGLDTAPQFRHFEK